MAAEKAGSFTISRIAWDVGGNKRASVLGRHPDYESCKHLFDDNLFGAFFRESQINHGVTRGYQRRKFFINNRITWNILKNYNGHTIAWVHGTGIFVAWCVLHLFVCLSRFVCGLFLIFSNQFKYLFPPVLTETRHRFNGVISESIMKPDRRVRWNERLFFTS